MRLRVLFPMIFVFGLMFCEESLAQFLPIAQPIVEFSTINSDDNKRFFDPAVPGIPVGDLDGDGIMDFIVLYSPFFDFRSEEEQPINKTLIKSFAPTGEIASYRVIDSRLYPAGDLDGDGNSELIMMQDGAAMLYSFASNGEAYVPSMIDLQVAPTLTEFETIRANKDLDGDGTDDLLICRNEFNNTDECEVLFGNSIDPSSPQLVSFNLSQLGLSTDTPYQVTIDESLTGTSNSIYFFGRTNFSQPNVTEVGFNPTDRMPMVNFQSDFNILSSESPSDRRYLVKDVDEDGQKEVLASDNREFNLGAGFVRFFFSDPICEVLEIDYSGVTPEIQPPQLISDNCVINIYRSNLISPRFYYGLWEEGNVSVGSGLNTSDGSFSMLMQMNDDRTRLPNNIESVQQALDNPGFIMYGVANPLTAMRGVSAAEMPDNEEDTFTLRLSLGFEFGVAAEARRTIPQRKPDTQSDAQVQVPNGNSTLLGDVFNLNNFSNASLLYDVRPNVPAEEQIDQNNVETRTNELDIVELIYTHLNEEADPKIRAWQQFQFKELNSTNNSVDSVDAEVVLDLSDFESFSNNSSIVIRNIGDIDGNPGEELLIGSGFSSDSSFNSLNKFWIILGSNTDYQAPDLTFELNNDTTITSFSNLGVGNEVANLGDVNGDGINDFALGLENFGDDFSYKGAVYVYAGQDFSTEAKAVTNPSEPLVILRPDTVSGQSISNFGTSVSGGDFDGDGFNDIAVVSQSGSGSPAPATVQVFKGGSTVDAIADYFLYATEEDFGGADPDTVSGLFSSFTVEFMPKDQGSNHQDLYVAPGGFSIVPDAVIFSGGSEPATTPSFRLAEPGPTPTSSGTFQGTKPVAGDFNGDGFYDVLVEKQFDNRDGVVSSRILLFSPNSDLNVSLDDENEIVNLYQLEQNFPNPFNPSTNIQFELPVASNVTLRVFNILGQEVATLINNERLTAGTQVVPFNASNLASGVYLYRIEAGNFVKTRKMTLIK